MTSEKLGLFIKLGFLFKNFIISFLIKPPEMLCNIERKISSVCSTKKVTFFCYLVCLSTLILFNINIHTCNPQYYLSVRKKYQHRIVNNKPNMKILVVNFHLVLWSNVKLALAINNVICILYLMILY